MNEHLRKGKLIRVRPCAILLAFLAMTELGWTQNTYYAPHILLGQLPNGDLWTTSFQLMNPSLTQSSTVTVQLMTVGGQPLNGFPVSIEHGGGVTSSETISLGPTDSFEMATNYQASMVSGWAVVQSTSPIISTAIIAQQTPECYVPQPSICQGFSINVAVANLQMNSALGQDFLFPARYSQVIPVPQASDSVGVALLNPSGSQSAAVTIQYLQGATVVNQTQITLPPQTKMAKFLNEWGVIPTVSSTSGTARVQSSQPLAITVIEVVGLSWLPLAASGTSP